MQRQKAVPRMLCLNCSSMESRRSLERLRLRGYRFIPALGVRIDAHIQMQQEHGHAALILCDSTASETPVLYQLDRVPRSQECDVRWIRYRLSC